MPDVCCPLTMQEYDFYVGVTTFVVFVLVLGMLLSLWAGWCYKTQQKTWQWCAHTQTHTHPHTEAEHDSYTDLNTYVVLVGAGAGHAT